MAEDAANNPIPAPLTDDHEDVSWALSTAQTTWARGERNDALKWLRRAAEAASEAEDDDRALTLAKAAADVASSLETARLTSNHPPAASPSAITSSSPSTPAPSPARAGPAAPRPTPSTRPPVPR